MTSGRLEKELLSEKKIERKLRAFNIPILSEWYTSMRASKKSYKTLECYINYIKNFYDFFCEGKRDSEFYKKVTASDIERYMISLETRTLPNGTIVRTGSSIMATRYSALRTFFDYLVNKRELIDKNPVDKVDRPVVNTEKQVVYLDKDEVNKVNDYQVDFDDEKKEENHT